MFSQRLEAPTFGSVVMASEVASLLASEPLRPWYARGTAQSFFSLGALTVATASMYGPIASFQLLEPLMTDGGIFTCGEANSPALGSLHA